MAGIAANVSKLEGQRLSGFARPASAAKQDDQENAMNSGSVLVTGANGLIGFDVVKRLAVAGRSVVAMDRYINEAATVTPNAFAVEIGDVHRLHEIASNFQIDAIVHCGGVSGPMLGRNNPANLFRVNVGGAVDVSELARQITSRRGSCRLVFCSSLTVYGNQPDDGITEDYPLLATGCYASSKIAGEAVVRSYANEHGVDAIVLRIAGVYGPRRKTHCILRAMIEDALDRRSSRYAFGKGFPRQFVHVDDVVRGIVLAVEAEAPEGRVYNLSGGVNPTIDEAAAIVREFLSDADIELQPGPDPEDVTLGLLSIEAAKRDLNYSPSVDLRDGIERLIESIKREAR
jgi:UDP-glucuronate 4-epimerase